MINIEVVKDVIWDQLPVIKITDYPWEQKAIKIFAQACLCFVRGKGLFIKQWSFEVNPPNEVKVNHSKSIYQDSLLTFVINNKNNFVSMSFNKNGNYIIIERKRASEHILEEKLEVDNFVGEDLQGVYWGVKYLIDDKFLNKYLNIDIVDGSKFYINFIKNSDRKGYRHCGGFLKIGEDIYENLQEAKVIDFNIQ